MAKLNYNLASKLKKLKKAARASFMVGNSPKMVSDRIGLSLSIVQDWHDDFVKELLNNGSSKRIFLRELLIKNSPQMILILSKLAQQQGDEKLAYSASSAVLSFASKFMAEDVRISNMEEKAKDFTGDDPMLKKTLFDFVDPDIDGANLNKNKVTSMTNKEEVSEELFEFLEGLGDEPLPPAEEVPDHARPNVEEVGFFDGIEEEEGD